MKKRESFNTRLGFLLVSAGCAIGIGNVWRFPYTVGENGGGIFVLLYIFFLIALGVPILSMEFAVGRASRKSPVASFKTLENKGSKWHLHGYTSMIGNYLLMAFYTTVTGWMLSYFIKFLTGAFDGKNPEQVQNVFQTMLSSPLENLIPMVIAVVLGGIVCAIGLQNGVEKITKVMMLGLLGIMVILVFKAVSLEGGMEGIFFYLVPDLQKAHDVGFFNIVLAAMNQSFFTLSLGIGSMAIFGSYLGKDRSLLGESVNVAILDSFVAILAGLIIFPACFAFGVAPDSGPSLVFVTLPNVFVEMTAGQIWGAFFFAFMSCAALSTVIAVFENILANTMELWKFSRKKSAIINIFIIIIVSIPCALGFNLLSDIQPLGDGSTILDMEDFILSNILLPLGALIYLLFCTTKCGWGFKNYQQEANIGKGLKVPNWFKFYTAFILPILIIFIFINGII